MSAQIRVEAYRRKDGLWAWRAIDESNGQVVGTDGGQGYEHRADCLDMAHDVTGRAPTVLLEVEIEDGAGSTDKIELT